jgi:DNA-binding NarL/FixJ family response regulator
MTEGVRIRVVIADDHPVFRDGLAVLLGRHDGIEVVGTADDGESALEICRAQRPDVVLVDLRMARLDGLAVVNELTRTMPETRAIVLSGFDADEDVFQAIRAGAAGYLLKHTSPEEVANAIHRVYEGERCIPPALAAKLAVHLSRPQLTGRQEQVLQLISEGLSNQEIAQRLNIVEGTVKAHVKSILAKLGARDRTQAIALAMHRGLVRL